MNFLMIGVVTVGLGMAIVVSQLPKAFDLAKREQRIAKLEKLLEGRQISLFITIDEAGKLAGWRWSENAGVLEMEPQKGEQHVGTWDIIGKPLPRS